jgi:integrase
MALGHEVRLMPPAYVKAYVKRGKTDAADAEAIAEAVTRPHDRSHQRQKGEHREKRHSEQCFSWRRQRDSNPRPSDYKSDLSRFQGSSRFNRNRRKMAETQQLALNPTCLRYPADTLSLLRRGLLLAYWSGLVRWRPTLAAATETALKLTKTLVEAEAAGPKDRIVWDAGLKNFGVKITPAGGRIYLVQYRPKGARTTRRVTIGPHGAPWTTDKARAHAADVLARVRLGEDPFAAEQARRTVARVSALEAQAEAERVQELRFDRIVEEFIEKYARPKNKRWDEAQRVLTSDDLAGWRDRSIDTLGRQDVIRLMDRVTRRAPAAARLLFAHLRKFFAWSVERLYLETSPCQGLRGPPAAKARDRWLNDAELSLVWLAAERLGEPFGPVVKLLILTGQRREEVNGMTLGELDFKRAEWTIGAERAKNGKAHVVDLAPSALALLHERTAKGGSPARLLFTTTGDTCLSGFGHAKPRLDAIIAQLQAEDAARRGAAPPAPLKPWRLHDLRRTAATGMARLGHAPHVVEAVLNHLSGARGGLVAVYQHYQYRPERKAALLGWANHVASITTAQSEKTNENRGLFDVHAA